MDPAPAAPADPRGEPAQGEAPAIGVASIPASVDGARPPAPVPSVPVPPEPTSSPARLASLEPAPGRSTRSAGSPPTDATPSPVDDRSGQDGFAPGVSAKLQSYVYLLVDPRTGRAFSVGRGEDDRCFRHVRAARGGSPPTAAAVAADEHTYPMLERIREVEADGREVRIDILRYGLSPDEASLVQAATHDALGLPGEPEAGSQRRSVAEAGALLAKRAKFKRAHQVVLLRVGGIGTDASYEVARHGWRIGRNWIQLGSVRSPQWAVIVAGTLVTGVHRIDRWDPTTMTPDPTPSGGSGGTAGGSTSSGRADRYSFSGPRDLELEGRYLGKSVAAYLGTGPPSPITYVWCGPHWVNTPP